MKVSAKQYANTLYELTENKNDSEVNNIIVKFVSYVKRSGDFKKTNDIVSQFSNVYNDKNGIIEAIVTSTRQLTSEEWNEIQSFIKNKYSAKSVIINKIVDKKIKGGIIIKVNDEVLDGSVRGRLKLLKRSLK